MKIRTANKSFTKLVQKQKSSSKVCTTNNNRITIDFVAAAADGSTIDGANGVCLDYRQIPC